MYTHTHTHLLSPLQIYTHTYCHYYRCTHTLTVTITDIHTHILTVTITDIHTHILTVTISDIHTHTYCHHYRYTHTHTYCHHYRYTLLCFSFITNLLFKSSIYILQPMLYISHSHKTRRKIWLVYMFVKILRTEFFSTWHKDIHISPWQQLHMSICITDGIDL